MENYDISKTILAKSDQLNAVDLPSQNLVVTIEGVKVSQKSEQPVQILLSGMPGRPYKPCLSMRRVLAKVWGTDSKQWIGRSLALYCDNSVTWAGKEVGGIRISSLSNIDMPVSVPIAKSQRVRELYTVEPLNIDWAQIADEIIKGINKASSDDGLDLMINELKGYPYMPIEQKNRVAESGKTKRSELKKTAA